MLLNVFNWISLFRKIPHSFLRPFFLLFYAFYVVFTGKNRSMATLFYLSIFFLLCRSHISFGNILGIKNHISSSFLLLLLFFLLEPADSRCSPGSYRQTRPINWHVVNPFRFTVDFLFFSSAATLGARRSSLIFFFSLFLLFFSYSWGWQPRSVQRRRSIRFIFFLFFFYFFRIDCDHLATAAIVSGCHGDDQHDRLLGPASGHRSPWRRNAVAMATRRPPPFHFWRPKYLFAFKRPIEHRPPSSLSFWIFSLFFSLFSFSSFFLFFFTSLCLQNAQHLPSAFQRVHY